MSTPSERFQGWVEGLSAAWRDRLKGWMAAVIGLGVEAFADAVAKKGASVLAPLLSKINAIPNLPPEIKPLLAELQHPTGEFSPATLMSISNRVAGGSIGAIIDSILAPIARAIHSVNPQQVIGFDAALELDLRGELKGADIYERGAWDGLSRNEVDQLRRLKDVNLPSDILLPLWLRDQAKYEPQLQKLRRLGLTQEQIDMLKELQYKVPTPQDIVTWLAREVFEPEQIAKYGLDDEWDKVDKTQFRPSGIKEETARNYWRAHWQHASWTQVTEMLHRRQMTEAEVWDWFRLVEIPPFWRDKLIKTAYNTYTRVDIRRMWDLGVLNDEELYDAYLDYGFDDARAKKMVLWTKVYQMTPQLIARYKNGYINESQVKAELVGYGLTPERAQWVLETKIKREGADRVADTRTITVAEIVKAVKQGQVDQENGVQLIESLGYEQWEARFKLSVALYQEPAIIPEERAIQIDTLRRRRRARKISRDQELESLQLLNLTAELATAYADNDDERLVKPYEGGYD